MLGETLNGKYHILRLLGQGGMGSVYEATTEGTNQRVAIKVISAVDHAKGGGLATRLQREAKAAGAIDAEHIPKVLETGIVPGTGAPYMVMEYLHGEDMQQLLSRLGPISAEAALRIAAQVCIGLTKAHSAGVMHRDIKPANLFLAKREDGSIVVKILDFGIAKIKMDEAHSAETTGLTRTGSMLGTPLYMSPEQARGIKTIDFRTDLWSLGIVLYRALSGRTPNEDIEAFGDLITALCSQVPRPIQEVAPWVAPEVAAVVHAALRYEPGNRFASAAAMLEAIKALLPSEAKAAGTSPAPGGVALHASMLTPLPEAARSVVAPKLEMSTGGTSARAGVRIRVADGPVIGTETTAHAAHTTQAVVQTAASSKRRRPTAKQLVAGRLLGLGLIVAIIYGAVRLGSTPATPQQAAAVISRIPVRAAPQMMITPPPAPTVDTSLTRRVVLSIDPGDASVEVGGAPAAVKDGVVEIVGKLGSIHRVRIWKGDQQVTGDVIITEVGASPAVMQISSTKRSVVTPVKESGPRGPVTVGASHGVSPPPPAPPPPMPPPPVPPPPTPENQSIRDKFE